MVCAGCLWTFWCEHRLFPTIVTDPLHLCGTMMMVSENPPFLWADLHFSVSWIVFSLPLMQSEFHLVPLFASCLASVPSSLALSQWSLLSMEYRLQHSLQICQAVLWLAWMRAHGHQLVVCPLWAWALHQMAGQEPAVVSGSCPLVCSSRQPLLLMDNG